jgi:hypothetical protein
MSDQSLSFIMAQTDPFTWQAQTLRFTVFLPAVPPSPTLNWFAAVAGKDADEELKRGGRLQQTGSFENGKLVLIQQQNRVDWLYAATEDPASADLPSVGEFTQTSRRFQSLLQAWLEGVPEVQRIAIGAVLLQKVESPVDGQLRLLHYLPRLVDFAAGTKDLVLHINRPKRAQAAPIEINRLTKWSTVQFVTYNIQVAAEGQVPAEAKTAGFAAQLELDFSTPGDASLRFQPPSVAALAGEIWTTAGLAATQGDAQ